MLEDISQDLHDINKEQKNITSNNLPKYHKYNFAIRIAGNYQYLFAYKFASYDNKNYDSTHIDFYNTFFTVKHMNSLFVKINIDLRMRDNIMRGVVFSHTPQMKISIPSNDIENAIQDLISGNWLTEYFLYRAQENTNNSAINGNSNEVTIQQVKNIENNEEDSLNQVKNIENNKKDSLNQNSNAQQGFQTIVLSEEELKNKSKIIAREFISDGEMIIQIKPSYKIGLAMLYELPQINEKISHSIISECHLSMPQVILSGIMRVVKTKALNIEDSEHIRSLYRLVYKKELTAYQIDIFDGYKIEYFVMKNLSVNLTLGGNISLLFTPLMTQLHTICCRVSAICELQFSYYL